MKKICSLDFLNREYFDTDVLSKDGKVLFATGEKITPEILLSLYFKEIFIQDSFIDELEAIQVEPPKEKTEEAVAQELEEFKKIKEEKIIEEPAAEIIKKNEDTEIPSVVQLELDEKLSAEIAKKCIKLAKLVKMPQQNIKELEQAALNYKIGLNKFTSADAETPKFKHQLAETSYGILINEKNLPEKIAEVAKYYLNCYNTDKFELDKKEPIPYYHIVSIVDYYETSINHLQKNETLDKMLQLGGNKFNIYVLHKFVKMMKENNE